MTHDDRDAASLEDPSEEPSRPGRTEKRSLPLWQETILLLALALGLAVVIKAVLLQAFYIPSESMEPGLVENDRIMVQKVSYWGSGTPRRGDVVVFEDPGGWLGPAEALGPSNPLTTAMAMIGLYPQGGHLVKRVIGVAGDVIACCDRQGRLRVNGVPLDEDVYLNHPDDLVCNGPMPGTECRWRAGPVPDGHVFVMGDNRDRSADSTVHMCLPQRETDCVPGEEFVPVDLVVGKVFALVWPVGHARWVTRPDSFEAVSGSP